MENKTTIQIGGYGLGTALAITISYTSWKSITWAMLHGLFGWGYVLYYAIVYK